MTSGFSMFGSAMSRSVNGSSKGVEVINPKGGKEDAKEEAQRGWQKDEKRDSYWKMIQKYIGSDITSMVTLPVVIFEQMTMLQKMVEVTDWEGDEINLEEDQSERRVIFPTSVVVSNRSLHNQILEMISSASPTL